MSFLKASNIPFVLLEVAISLVSVTVLFHILSNVTLSSNQTYRLRIDTDD